MDQIRALEVIQSLAAGADPFTGEIFEPGNLLQNPDVVRALFIAATALQTAPKSSKRPAVKNPALPAAAGKPWSEAEDEQLAKAFDDGLSEKELALKHARTSGGIRARLVKLGRLDPASYERRAVSQ